MQTRGWIRQMWIDVGLNLRAYGVLYHDCVIGVLRNQSQFSGNQSLMSSTWFTDWFVVKWLCPGTFPCMQQCQRHSCFACILTAHQVHIRSTARMTAAQDLHMGYMWMIRADVAIVRAPRLVGFRTWSNQDRVCLECLVSQTRWNIRHNIEDGKPHLIKVTCTPSLVTEYIILLHINPFVRVKQTTGTGRVSACPPTCQWDPPSPNRNYSPANHKQTKSAQNNQLGRNLFRHKWRIQQNPLHTHRRQTQGWMANADE